MTHQTIIIITIVTLTMTLLSYGVGGDAGKGCVITSTSNDLYLSTPITGTAFLNGHHIATTDIVDSAISALNTTVNDQVWNIIIIIFSSLHSSFTTTQMLLVLSRLTVWFHEGDDHPVNNNENYNHRH